MDKNIIKESLVKFFKKHGNQSYTAFQCVSSIGLRKTEQADVQSVLNELVQELFIEKIGKKYSLRSDFIEEIVEKEEPALKEKEAKTVTGTFDATSLAKNMSFAYVIMDDGIDIKISAEDTLNAYHRDIVEVELIKNKANRRIGIIKRIIERYSNKFVGTVDYVSKKKLFICDNLKIHNPFQISGTADNLKGKKVVIEIDNWGNRLMNQLPSGKIVEVLGDSGLPEVELLAVIRDFDLPLEFPEEVLKEALAIDGKITEADIAKRSDFRDIFTFTIDPISAKDFDDAISLEELGEGKLRLYVHIADLAHYIKLDGEIFKEALNRGNSYYFPKKVLPMLPEALSNKMCSLRPDEEKMTVTVITDFDNNGAIISQDIKESVICSNARLSYEEVDLLFEDKEHGLDENIVKTLNLMRFLSQQLYKKRVQKGYLSFDLPEVEYIFDDEGYLVDLKRSQETDSHRLIENFMLVANEFVAKRLTKLTGTTIYRIHEEPNNEDLMKIKDILKFHKISFQVDENINKTWQNVLKCLPTEEYHRVFDRMVLRSMKKAKYSTAHIAHFGLGIPTYTHFTSPIRRLCDLIVHFQLKKYEFHKALDEVGKNDLSSAAVFNYAGIATKKEALADESERAMEDKTLLAFMKKKVGDEFTGIIIAFTNSAMVIELDDLPVRGIVKYMSLTDDFYELYERLKVVKGRRRGRVFKLADKVEVSVDMVTDDIYFSLKCEAVTKVHKKKRKKKK
ncbi:MAG TPA: VacB/RNase II family 3'-5' exoribonuclease [Candidatus Cloacimonadota bacterium]|nr:VacB/RNase II family 3'-5' exoribonuclease [Candidatus Cloacimonadota bacterium]